MNPKMLIVWEIVFAFFCLSVGVLCGIYFERGYLNQEHIHTRKICREACGKNP